MQPAQVVGSSSRSLGRERSLTTSLTSKPPAGLEHAEGFGEDLALIAGEINHTVGKDHIHGAILDGQGVGLAQAELDLGVALLFSRGAGALDHGGGHIHADHMPGFSHPVGGEEGIDPAAAADIQGGLAGLQGGDGGGIAAAERDFRGFRGDLGAFCVRIAADEGVVLFSGGAAAG